MPRRWTPAAVARRSLEVLRADGLAALAFKVLGETVYRRMRWYERPLAELPPLGAGAEFEYGFLEPAAVPSYVRLRGNLEAAEVEARLRRGDRCYVATDGGTIACAHWLAAGTARIDYLGREFSLAPGDVYLYETFTAPAYRGRGLPAATARRLCHVLAAEGQRQIVGAVVPENRAALAAFRKTSYRHVGTIGYVRLGPWRRDFTRIRR